MNAVIDGFDAPRIRDVSNRQTPKKKKGGGFQGMGLTFSVLKGIQKRGYKIPTPIQRKTIPVALDGRDVVAMARTGSGKTACFLIPLFEKLLNSVKKPGARGLIFSPTRELAVQTLKFIKEIGKFTGLKAAAILGGDSLETQFAILHSNPDIIVATPGRLMHICVEMSLKLQYTQYVVFDEADRLFEMGFGEQLQELIKRLPEERQTLLFSATLPKKLVEFAKAGLNEPVLIRLDVESKMPEKLELVFLCCRSDEKVAALLYMLKLILPSHSQSVVFAATKHHVEYLTMILDSAGISNTFIYSSLDPSARKINAAKFQLKKVSVLIVTDVAARGIDIPHLDFVINFHFPSKPKLFVHRVGRCARAGRTGTAYSLLSCEEFPYLFDLQLFLGRNLEIGESNRVVGSFPRELLEEDQSELLKWHNDSSDLSVLQNVYNNGYKAYLRSRPGALVESVRQAKELGFSNLKPHKIFDNCKLACSSENQNSLLDGIRRYRPNGTIFEVGVSSKSAVYTVMKAARRKHHGGVENYKRKLELVEKKGSLDTEFSSFLPKMSARKVEKKCDDVSQYMCLMDKTTKKTPIDTEFFIKYLPEDHHTEQGLMVNSFQTEVGALQLDLTADNSEDIVRQKNNKIWDRKKRKFVGTNQDSKTGKIRTESGVWISASYKSDRYAQWKEKNKVEENETSEEDSDEKEFHQKKAFMKKKFPNTHWGRHNSKIQQKMKSELKKPEQILKIRKKKEKEEWRLKRKREKRRRK